MFTIILPVWNGGTYLVECVNSIINQTFKQFELVLLDSNSNDGSSEYLLKIAENDTRVKYFNSKKNLTIEQNWARALDVRKQKFITIIGQDDLYEENFLEEIAKLIHKFPDANLYATHFKIINADGGLLRYCKPIPRIEYAEDFLSSRLSGIRDSFAIGYVMRSTDYERIGGVPIFKDLLYSDDALMLSVMNSGFKVTSQNVCFSYRLHESTSGAPNKKNLFNALISYLKFLDNCGFSDTLSQSMYLYSEKYITDRCKEYFDSLDNQKVGYHDEVECISSLLQRCGKLDLLNCWQNEKNKPNKPSILQLILNKFKL